MNTALAHDTVTLAGRHDPSYPEPETRWEIITPDIARRYLEQNTTNRPLSKPYVNELASELADGRFLESHQGIAFAADGRLLDGQHRLHAIVKADVPARILVTRNLHPNAWHVIDQVRKRTAGQILSMSGITKDAPRMAAIARAILLVPRGHSRVTNTQSTEFAINHADVFGKYLSVAKKYTPAVAAAFAWCELIGWDPELLKDCAKRLVELDFGGDDPMRALARRAEESFKTMGQGDAAIREKFTYTFGALQAAKDGRGLRQLRKSQPNFQAIERESQRPPAGDRDERVTEAERPSAKKSGASDNSDEELETLDRSQIVVDEDMRSAAALYGFNTPDMPGYDERVDGEMLDLYLRGRIRDLEELAEIRAMIKADREREREAPAERQDPPDIPAFLRR